MCLEIHNFTLYKGMSDRLYRTIDKEVGRAQGRSSSAWLARFLPVRACLLRTDQSSRMWTGPSRSGPWKPRPRVLPRREDRPLTGTPDAHPASSE